MFPAFFSHCSAAAYGFCLLDLESESVARAVRSSYSKETCGRSAEESVTPPCYLPSPQLDAERLMSPSCSFLPKISSGFHYSPALFPSFTNSIPPAEAGRRLLSRGRARNPEAVNPALIPGSLKCELSVFWFFNTRPGSRAIMGANWLMISCLV